MLASFGFLLTAIVLFLFAFTFDKVVKKDDRNLRSFGFAYLLIGVAFLMWGFLGLANAQSSLAHSVLIGDVLIFAATTAALLILVPKKWQHIMVLSAATCTLIIMFIRIKYFYPDPFILNGILYFNIQHPIAILISVVVLGWLPACMKAARIITDRKNLPHYYPFYLSAYIITIITAALFIQAQRRLVIIESFIAFGLSVLVLLLSNLTALSIKSVKVKHAGK